MVKKSVEDSFKNKNVTGAVQIRKTINVYLRSRDYKDVRCQKDNNLAAAPPGYSNDPEQAGKPQSNKEIVQLTHYDKTAELFPSWQFVSVVNLHQGYHVTTTIKN